jgi:hypothetical protein
MEKRGKRSREQHILRYLGLSRGFFLSFFLFDLMMGWMGMRGFRMIDEKARFLDFRE